MSDDVTDPGDSIGLLRSRCDLDLLVFFARHPCAMLTSELLATFLGYELAEIAESLDVLLGAGLLTRHQTPAHAARMYLFAGPADPDGWLSRLVRLASTREGRLALRATLGRGSAPPSSSGQGAASPLQRGPRRLDDTHEAATRALPGREDKAG